MINTSSVNSLAILHMRALWYRYINRRKSYNDVIVRETIMSYVLIGAYIQEYLAQTCLEGMITLLTSL